MTEFFQTHMGKQFFDGTMPRLARAIEALNQSVGGLNARLDEIHGENKKTNAEVLEQAQQAREENEEILELLRTEPKVPIGEFKECDACRAKPGSPVLCEACLHNRGMVHDLKERLDAAIRRERLAGRLDSSDLSRRACEMAGALQQLLWCDGEGTEHDSDVLGEIANITRRYGFGPEKA